MPVSNRRSIAVVYPCRTGVGGWGQCVAAAIRDLMPHFAITAIGPGFVESWALSRSESSEIRWIDVEATPSTSLIARVQRRIFPGRDYYLGHCRLGTAIAAQLEAAGPQAVYAFTHVALESLRWAKQRGIPTFLENVNVHLGDMREALVAEARRYGCGVYRGYPTSKQVARGSAEFEIADHIRVCSDLSKKEMVARGVPADKIEVLPLPINLASFRPASNSETSVGPLRLCFVGSLDLRKGFVPLLRAIRKLSPDAVSLEFVGNTGDSCSKRLLEQERTGLNVVVGPGDPRPAFARADVFVLPSLEDGFGIVVPEAMASGLPVIVTDRCGAAEWVRPGETGWIVPAGDVEALASALREAIRRRAELPELGRAARASVEEKQSCRSPSALADWVRECLSKN